MEISQFTATKGCPVRLSASEKSSSEAFLSITQLYNCFPEFQGTYFFREISSQSSRGHISSEKSLPSVFLVSAQLCNLFPNNFLYSNIQKNNYKVPCPPVRKGKSASIFPFRKGNFLNLLCYAPLHPTNHRQEIAIGSNSRFGGSR